MFTIHRVMGLSCMVRLAHFIRNNNYIDQLVILFREIQWLNTLENWRARGTLSQIAILLIMIGFFMQQTTVNNGKKGTQAAGYPFVWSQVVLYCVQDVCSEEYDFYCTNKCGQESKRGGSMTRSLHCVQY